MGKNSQRVVGSEDDMRGIIFVISMFLSIEAVAGEAPDKFKNPIFNDILYSGGNKTFSQDIRVTPTSIKNYDNEVGDAICTYLVEDDKGFLLKCDNTKLLKNGVIETYEMFYARYQTDFTDVGGRKECNVWNCSFEIKDGKIVPYGANRPVPNYSRVYICEDEKDYYNDFGGDKPKMNCMDELKARGFEKYIPGKWEKIVNEW